jgi:superfamily I DNA/RNA helicase
VRLAGFPGVVYSGYLRSGGGVNNYDIFFYEDEETQLEQLGKWLRELKTEGYRPAEITLLSLRADHLSAANNLSNAGYKLRPAWRAGHETSYASVHAFKGMENKVIILTDVALDDREFQRDLFYTGMTRATESVRVSCSKESQDVLHEWLRGV